MPSDAILQVAAVARPGDTVLIGLREQMCDEELSEFTDQFKGFTETTGIHIALIEGAVAMVVARPDTDDEFDKEFPDEGQPGDPVS